jgi:hypothetical protein
MAVPLVHAGRTREDDLMEVEGVAAVAGLGILGGAITEILRVVAYMREHNKLPGGLNLITSVVYALLGAGVLFYGTDGKSSLEVAHLGAAFPLLWSAGVRAVAGGGGGGGTLDTSREPTWLEYTGWRFR